MQKVEKPFDICGFVPFNLISDVIFIVSYHFRSKFHALIRTTHRELTVKISISNCLSLDSMPKQYKNVNRQ